LAVVALLWAAWAAVLFAAIGCDGGWPTARDELDAGATDCWPVAVWGGVCREGGGAEAPVLRVGRFPVMAAAREQWRNPKTSCPRGDSRVVLIESRDP